MHGKNDWIKLAYYAKSEANFFLSSIRLISIETFTNKATFPGALHCCLIVQSIFSCAQKKSSFLCFISENFQSDDERWLMYEKDMNGILPSFIITMLVALSPIFSISCLAEFPKHAAQKRNQ